MGDFRVELAALVAAYDNHRKWTLNPVFKGLHHAVEHARAVLNEPAAIESWHIPRALSNEALRLLTRLPMGEIERRLRVSVPAPVQVGERLPGDQLCWWFESDEDCGYGSNWTLLRIRGSATGYTHWLPANALPLPEVK